MASDEPVFNLIDLTNKSNVNVTNTLVNEASQVMQLPDSGLKTSETIAVWDEENAILSQGDCGRCSILQKVFIYFR